MAILDILKYPDERLHTVAAPVAEVNDQIRHIVSDMAETMYASKGIGLAATQVNIHQQIVVMDLSEERNELRAQKVKTNVLSVGSSLSCDGILLTGVRKLSPQRVRRMFYRNNAPLNDAYKLLERMDKRSFPS